MVDLRGSHVVRSDDLPNQSLDFENDKTQLPAFIKGQEEMVRLAGDVIESAFASGNFTLKISLFARMHKAGYQFLRNDAGVFRTVKVFVGNSNLIPPPANDVVEMLDEMCEYINCNMKYSDLYHIGAYMMWRFLYIHPFVDGNGSIARLTSYIVMQIKAGPAFHLGTHMFEAIANNRAEYYDVLSSADEQWLQGRLNLSGLEAFLRKMTTYSG